MTLESTISSVSYVGNGSTAVFPFPFKIWRRDQLRVFVGNGETEQDVTSSCVVATTATGGTVTFPVPPKDGARIAIYRDMPFTQTDDYRNGTRFDAEEIEDRLDQDCAERQQLLAETGRALKVPRTSSGTGEDLIASIYHARDDAVSAASDIAAWLAEVGTEVANSSYVTARGTSAARTLADRFADIVNVLDYGVKNDGSEDVAVAIQAVIDANEGRTIYFPEGKYLISEPIETSSSPAKAVMLVLDPNAVVKASSDFELGEFMLKVGVKDTTSMANGDAFGVIGGQFDTNKRASGIYYSGEPVSGQFYNIRILNSYYVGMQVGDAEHTGVGDAWIENVFVHAPQDPGADTQVGLVLYRTDNNVIALRTFSGFCGIKIFAGGQYIKDAHIVGYDEAYTTYENTVGFDFHEASYECTFDSCYSDNFSVGFWYGNQHSVMTNCECYWYSNDNHKHICIKHSGSTNVFYGRCDGLKVGVPENGNNYILYPTANNLNVYNFDYGPASGRIINTILKEYHSRLLKHPLSEYASLSYFTGCMQQLSNDRNTAVANKWYPVASFAISSFVGGGNTFVTICNENLYIELRISLNATLGWDLTGDKLIQNNGASIVLGFGALDDCFKDNGGTVNTSMMLYLKYTNVGSGSLTNFVVNLHENGCIGMYSWPRNICSSGVVSGYYELDSIPNQIGRTVNFAGNWTPYTDNQVSLGWSGGRFKEVFAATGTINTSDARDKTSVETPSESLMRAWDKVRFKVFQFTDAVSEKGANLARHHVGVVAQDVAQAFASEGLDAERFGLFCHDEWEAEYAAETVVDTPVQYNEKGEMVADAQTHVETRLVRPAGDRYGIRYEEALALECAYQRWRLEQLEERVIQLTNNTNN